MPGGFVLSCTCTWNPWTLFCKVGDPYTNTPDPDQQTGFGVQPTPYERHAMSEKGGPSHVPSRRTLRESYDGAAQPNASLPYLAKSGSTATFANQAPYRSGSVDHGMRPTESESPTINVRHPTLGPHPKRKRTGTASFENSPLSPNRKSSKSSGMTLGSSADNSLNTDNSSLSRTSQPQAQDLNAPVAHGHKQRRRHSPLGGMSTPLDTKILPQLPEPAYHNNGATGSNEIPNSYDSESSPDGQHPRQMVSEHGSGFDARNSLAGNFEGNPLWTSY